MRKIEIAEAILSLAADRERAAAIAGDLLEESRDSALRFWCLVVETAGLHAGRQLSTSPFSMLRAAIRAWFVTFGYILLGVTVPAVAAMIRPGLAGSAAIAGWTWVTGQLVVPFLLGRWMARRYPGREGSVMVSSVVLQYALYASVALLLWEFARVGPDGLPKFGLYPLRGIPLSAELFREVLLFVIFTPLTLIVTAAGSAFARYKSLRGVAHA